ncbi:hypothetical protein PRUPE_6G265700 [Prunus persica]|uniref:Copper transport protein n=1 Tax=Prunus persica TaxID=3760 RepID=M5W6J7_PRUPE|nr:copper transporter 6 [Prunus persica]ONI03568.1 hypothetical protein PRUPE_6G265700 [Prunus persica]
MAASHHNILSPPPPAFNGSTGFMPTRRRKMMMHMTFFWGHSAEVLFSGWPGRDNPVMYALSLLCVFVLAVLVELLSHCSVFKPGANGLAVGFLQTGLYTLRSGLSYLVMLAVMSFNGGVFLAVVAGHAVGFLLFGSRAFKKSDGSGIDRQASLPPMTCG